MQGSPTVTCLSTAQWDSQPPLCVPSNTCPEPAPVPHALTRVSDASYRVNTRIDYVCDSGFTLQGRRTITCMENNQWDSDPPRCTEPGRCSDPGTPENGVRRMSDQSLVSGTRIEYSCLNGHKMEGRSVITCMENAQWDSDIPRCVEDARCSEPRTPEHGMKRASDNSYVINTRVEFACEIGYRLVGNPVISCTNNGDWDSEVPQCVQDRQCVDPGTPDSGMRDVSDPSFQINSRVVFVCHSGYTMQGYPVITCTENAEWDFPVPSCMAENQCQDPGTPNNMLRRVSDPAFKVDSIIEFSCESGLNMVGRSVITCLEGGRWDIELPHCARDVRCPEPNIPGNVLRRMSDNSLTPGSKIEFACENGNRLEGASVITCLETGRWDFEVPSCADQRRCPDPGTPEHGLREVSDNSFSINTRIVFGCEAGFTLQGQVYITCMADTQWNYPIPSCDADRVCSDPGTPQNAMRSITNDRFTINSRIEFVCHDGFSLQGQASISCLSNGQWDFAIPTCVDTRRCSDPGMPQNAVRTLSDNSFRAGTKVVYGCQNGFTLRGMSIITCLDNNLWDFEVPSCTRETRCSDPRTPQNGMKRISGEGFRPETRVEFACQAGYSLQGRRVITCLINGQWDSPRPSCVLDKRCNDPGVPTNGRRTVSDSTLRVDSRIDFQCQEGFTIQGNVTITCLSTGDWDSVIPRCVRDVQCQDPGLPDNSGRSLSDSTLRVNTVIEYVCDSDYILQGRGIITCLNNGLWDFHIPSCVRNILCQNPGVPQNGFSSDSSPSFRPDSQIQYSCRSGYSIQGNSLITCLSTGQWDSGLPSCSEDVRCYDPGTIDNGERTLSDNTLSITTQVEYYCHHGYTLSGRPVITCLNSGQWNHAKPSCVSDIRCQDPGTPLYASRTLSDPSFRKASTIRFTCDMGYTLRGPSVTTCRDSSQWDNSLPFCVAEIRCEDPGTPQFGRRTVSDPNFGVDSTVKYSCQEGYSIQGRGTIRCRSPGRWDASTPTCLADDAGLCV